MDEFDRRRNYSEKKLAEISGQLSKWQSVAKESACVYATGSFGRLEACANSDLDVFILGKNDPNGARTLSRLDEICIKADLIQITRKMNIPEFSGDGAYLKHFTLDDLTKTLGTPEDDVSNTFTARLLLLLESRALFSENVHNYFVEEVIAKYWRDYEDHSAEFMPAFLANDILRLWRTFCVNYEARTKSSPDREKAKRKLKNYKLKHSRLLTCYSALLYLLSIYVVNGTVTPIDAKTMVRTTPVERLRWLAENKNFSSSSSSIQELIGQYEKFLETTAATEDELVTIFLDRSQSGSYMANANALGDKLFTILKTIGNDSPFHRILVI